MQAGDTVAIGQYTKKDRWDHTYPGDFIQHVGVITAFTKPFGEYHEQPLVRVVKNESARLEHIPLKSLTLLQAGPGHFLLGQTHPYTEEEKKKLRYAALWEKCMQHDLSHMGFPNPATYLADLYLSQSTPFQAIKRSLFRKDNSVSPTKLKRAFFSLKIEIDSWAFTFPFEIPKEFQNHAIPFKHRMQIDWLALAKSIEQTQ